MKTRSLLLAVAALAVVLASAASALASTASERRSWALSAPEVYSHGQAHGNLCGGSALFRRNDGSWADAFGPNHGCNDMARRFPVHRGSRLAVKTSPEARAVTLSIVKSQQPFRARDSRTCTRFAARLWECRFPSPGRARGPALLKLDYPGARSTWSFDYDGHSPDRH